MSGPVEACLFRVLEGFMVASVTAASFQPEDICIPASVTAFSQPEP